MGLTSQVNKRLFFHSGSAPRLFCLMFALCLPLPFVASHLPVSDLFLEHFSVESLLISTSVMVSGFYRFLLKHSTLCGMKELLWFFCLFVFK